MSETQPRSGAKGQLARWLSVLLDSSVLAVPVFLGAAWSETGTFLPALGWSALALLFVDGIPLTYIALGRRFGWVSGFDLPRRVRAESKSLKIQRSSADRALVQAKESTRGVAI
jgi:hypothetical protein